jgi:hypothetical protein
MIISVRPLPPNGRLHHIVRHQPKDLLISTPDVATRCVSATANGLLPSSPPPLLFVAHKVTLALAYGTDDLGKQICSDEAVAAGCEMLTIWTYLTSTAFHVGHNDLDAASS